MLTDPKYGPFRFVMSLELEQVFKVNWSNTANVVIMNSAPLTNASASAYQVSTE